MEILRDTTTEQAVAYVREACDRAAEQGKRPAAFVLTFGCQQNEADSEKIRGLADLMGYARAVSAAEADLILVNTCAIREHAELKALSIIGSYKKYKEQNPSLIIGVCGCMAAEAHRVEEIKHRYPAVDFTLEPGDIGQIPMLVAGVKIRRRRFFLHGDANGTNEGIPTERSCRHRAWVSIMYGCNNFCSYCIVPYVRGRERSRRMADIVAEVKQLIERGAKDITLLGQNVNSYRDGTHDFAQLLAELDAIPGEYILRFMTSHPKDASDALVEVIGKSRHIEPHFHLPLQSGSDAVLKAMNRHYDRERYLSVVDKLRKVRPDIALTSDIIVGFPGETDADFEATLDILKTVRFDSVYAFIYSPRKGTPAAAMDGQIPSAVQHERFDRLLALQSDISRDCNAASLGKTLRVLVDGPSKNNEGMFSGRTDAGKLVHFAADETDIGTFCCVRIDRADSFALFGIKQETERASQM